jgi:UrcA family protein
MEKAMTRNRITLLGSAILGAVLLCGSAGAQDYYGPYYRYEPQPGDEVVIVHPDYDYIEKRQVTGRINGEVNPTEYTISRPVNFSDLDLRRGADYIELRERVRATARDMCFELEARVPQLRGDSSANRECVRDATRNAMRDVLDRRG